MSAASRTLVHRGLRLHYVDAGRGPPVVMVHGNPTSSFYFRALVDALAPDHRCLALDHVGCGRSDTPDESRYDYTLARRVEDLTAWLAAVAPEGPVTLVVHDWGGMIGLAWAVRHPARIARLVLMNTAGFALPPGARLPWPLRLARSPLGPLLVRGLNAFVLGTLAIGTRRRTLDRAEREAYLRPHDSWARRIATLRFVQDIPLHEGDRAMPVVREVEAGLARLARVPALVLWGLDDPVFDARFLARWRQLLPRARVHAWEDVGHLVLEDAPDRAVPLVRAFLTGRTAPAHTPPTAPAPAEP